MKKTILLILCMVLMAGQCLAFDNCGIGFFTSGKKSPLLKNNNTIIVGQGGDFTDIAEAMASITDNAVDNPYQILLLPGVYTGWGDSKQYVDVIGSGRNSTVIETSFTDYIRINSYSELANFKIQHSSVFGSATVRGAVEKVSSNSVTEAVLRNIEIDVDDSIQGHTQPKYAISFGGGVNLTAYNLKIRTAGGGIRLNSGNSRFHNCDIYFDYEDIGLPRYGIIMENGNRLDWYGGRIGTGYYYDQDVIEPDEDIIGLYIPATNTSGNCRAEIHDAEMFARNADANLSTKVHAVRADNGWVRMYGCYVQTELGDNTNSNTSKSIHAVYGTADEPATGDGGRVETYGCRVRSMYGFVHGGAGIQGPTYYDVSHNNNIIQRYEGLAVCDATSGAFTLKLPTDEPATEGHEVEFYKSDASANAITIDGNGNTINGAATHVLSSQYDKVRLRRTKDGWIIL